jgi:hypothetical protein
LGYKTIAAIKNMRSDAAVIQNHFEWERLLNNSLLKRLVGQLRLPGFIPIFEKNY